MSWLDFLGYAASFLVAVSLMMSSIARLRALNMVGAFAFAIYGYLAGAYPVFVVNAFIAVINVIFLLKMQPGRSEAFELLFINRIENKYLQRFLAFHQADIQQFFPNFKSDEFMSSKVVLILRDMLPVGVVICEQTDEETLTIHLDYVIPSHRDFRCADYFYTAWNEVIEGEKVIRFVARGEVDPHRKYLRRIGFKTDHSLGKDLFVRQA